jgi:polyferredoxin
MNLAFLKKIRLVVSLVFFILILLLFIDLHGWFTKISEPLLYLQFVPSLVEFISLLTVSALGFAFIILLNFLFGRVYCSTICPLGTFQDVITYTSRKMKTGRIRRKFHKYSLPKNVLRYAILGIVILSFIMGLDFYRTFSTLTVILAVFQLLSENPS